MSLVPSLAPALLAEIHAEAFSAPWNEAAMASLLDSPGVFVRGNDQGFIMIRVIVDEAEILTVGVRPSARRSGLGRQLVEQAIVEAAGRGAGQMFLEVAESNVAARGLYSSCGFEASGLRRNYYKREDGSREDALMMVLKFPL